MTFDFKTNCFICSEKCGKDERHPDRTKEWCRAETLGSHDTILKLCSERLEKLPNDQQVVSIKRRILSCTDLVAAEGRYHKKCRGLHHCKLHSLVRKVSRKFRRDKLFYNCEKIQFFC